MIITVSVCAPAFLFDFLFKFLIQLFGNAVASVKYNSVTVITCIHFSSAKFSVNLPHDNKSLTWTKKRLWSTYSAHVKECNTW